MYVLYTMKFYIPALPFWPLASVGKFRIGKFETKNLFISKCICTVETYHLVWMNVEPNESFSK